MGHGIARLYHRTCTDWMRLLSIPQYEAEIWDQRILSQWDDQYCYDILEQQQAPPDEHVSIQIDPEQHTAYDQHASYDQDLDIAASYSGRNSDYQPPLKQLPQLENGGYVIEASSRSSLSQQGPSTSVDAHGMRNRAPGPQPLDSLEGGDGWEDEKQKGRKLNQWLRYWGGTQEEAADILNPGFQDPFDVRRDITLEEQNYKIFGWALLEGKLDWMLLRRLKVANKQMGNHDYRLSDHKWLLVDVKLQ